MHDSGAHVKRRRVVPQFEIRRPWRPVESLPARCHIAGMAKTPKRPRDPNQLGKLIVDLSTGEAEEQMPVEPPKNEAAAELGRKGGAARARAMTPERRAEIAKRAAEKRWEK